jgi:hypothetical protein
VRSCRNAAGAEQIWVICAQRVGLVGRWQSAGCFAGRILSGVTAAVRTAAERKADTFARFEADAGVWPPPPARAAPALQEAIFG